ncbi:hypothetical protein F9831_00090 [Streptococcus suis]|nr:hypothetical protein [Streptococcus suis]
MSEKLQWRFSACYLEMGVGKNSTIHRRVRLPTPAQLIRSDLECKTRTNLPINHCAEMLTLTLRSGAGLFAQLSASCPRLLLIFIEY